MLTGCRFPKSAVRDPRTVATLLSGDPFFIAHRGGGGNWPEMTAYAYAQAAKISSLKALEISVCLTADDVLVCSHDPTTTRVTGVPYTIREQTWDTLSKLRVRARNTSDPHQQSQPFSRFDSIAETYINDFVLFVEAKVPEANEPLMQKMVSLGHPERVVWKQWVTSSEFATAKQNGFGTWGYVLNEQKHLDNLAQLAASPDIDMLGAPADESDAFVNAVVAAAAKNHKSTIMWAISTAEDEVRGRGLGCRGFMVSNVQAVLGV